MVERINSFEEITFDSIKGILIDLDNTIYDYSPANDAAREAARDHAIVMRLVSNSEEFEDLYEQARQIIHERLDGLASSHSRLLYFKTMLELKHPGGEVKHGAGLIRHVLDLEEVYWSKFLDKMRFKKGFLSFIKRVKEADIKTCIVTDLTEQIQIRKIVKLGLLHDIDFMISSEEAGVEKPDARIFKLALQKLQMTESEVIMIGDHEYRDSGADALGIKTLLLNF